MPEDAMPPVPSRYHAAALALVLAATHFVGAPPPAAAQTWDGSSSTDWNTAANWTPATVPNSPTAAVNFTGTALGTINISASVQAQSLTFTNPTGNYTLTSSVGQTLSGVTDITVGSGVTGTE